MTYCLQKINSSPQNSRNYLENIGEQDGIVAELYNLAELEEHTVFSLVPYAFAKNTLCEKRFVAFLVTASVDFLCVRCVVFFTRSVKYCRLASVFVGFFLSPSILRMCESANQVPRSRCFWSLTVEQPQTTRRSETKPYSFVHLKYQSL